jgi:predicted nucleic acid-binding protein
MTVVDSSGWLEYFGGGPNATRFAPAIDSPGSLLVPAIVLYEVYKRFSQMRTEREARTAAGNMKQGIFVEVSSEIALLGARLSLQHKLPMADSLILATARIYEAELWTMDSDFEGFDGVRFIPKR